MELKWLEDYLALAKYNNFSEAAKARHLTQPAFSRRIRLLEDWLNVLLVNRKTNPIKLTLAGYEFLAKAEILVNQIYKTKDELHSFNHGRNTITIHSQHSLMISHVPKLLENIQPILDEFLVRFEANNQQDAVCDFLDNENDFLLCFVALGIPQRLADSKLDEICIDQDRLVAVSSMDEKGKILHDPKKTKPLKILSYPRGSFFHRLIEKNHSELLHKNLDTQVIFENVLASGLKQMVLQGYGIAWLPEKLLTKEIQKQKIVVLNHKLFPPIPLKINLYKHKSASSTISDILWKEFSK